MFAVFVSRKLGNLLASNLKNITARQAGGYAFFDINKDGDENAEKRMVLIFPTGFYRHTPSRRPSTAS